MDDELLARDLGTGFGTPEHLALLTAGQARKTDILLRLLVRRRPSLAEAHAQLRGVDLLGYPHLGTWVVHCLRGEVPPADLAYLGWVVAAHHIRSGLPGTVPVVVRNGQVMLPGLGMALAGEDGPASLTVSSHGFSLTAGDGRLVVPDPRAEDDPAWLPLRALGGPVNLGGPVFLDDLDPFRDLSDPYTKAQLDAPPPRLTPTQAASWARAYRDAQAVLHEHFPSYAAGIDHVLRAVVPLTAEPVPNGVSNTSLHAFGVVNMSAAAGPHQFALSLIHECQHTKLTALTDQAELQTPSAVKDLYAPWRDDPRPLSGLLQGIYAHIGVTDFWRVYRKLALTRSGTADVEFARWRTQVGRALDVAAGSDLLTEAGRIFVAAMSRATAHWALEEVPSPIEKAAADAAAEHLTAWRVRNMTVDPPGLKALAARWSAGHDPGELPSSRLVSPATVPRRLVSAGSIPFERPEIVAALQTETGAPVEALVAWLTGAPSS